MLEYEVFKNIFDEKIFAKSKPDLLKKVAEYPDRYVGLFRPTKPEAKLLQNLLQSNEIRFGDAFEVAIKQYFINEGWQPLPQKITSKEGDALDIDQLLIKDDKVLFIEQKVRDDHDSTKKRGQISNFERIVSQILPVLFPTGATLAILESYFRTQNLIVESKIADSIRIYLQTSPHLSESARSSLL